MDKPFNRRDLGYTIISRFEESFRAFLADELRKVYPNFLDGIPHGIIEKVKDKASKGNWADAMDFLEDTDFPDLMDIAIYKDHYKNFFQDSSISQDEFQSHMKSLYFLRCKIAHVRNYFTTIDLEELITLSKRILENLNNYKKDFFSFLNILQLRPEEAVIPMPTEFACETKQDLIPNNLPVPDYEYEGGFVGRAEYKRKITEQLQGDLHRVITLSGAGGVGKTALALNIAQNILKGDDILFDGIIWLSAKESRLSYLGIEEFEPAVKTYDELLETFSTVMGFGSFDSSYTIEEKENHINTILDLHNKRILLIIDNLETITDERIINFILDAPSKLKILITSRKGLGQVERRYDLKQLKEKEAIFLFRLIAKDKQLDSLLRLDDAIIIKYVNKVSCYPLAIKWVLGKVASGKDINSVIESIHAEESDISRFCFEQIYKDLTSGAKKLLCTLAFYDEPVSAGVLQYVAGLVQKDFEDAISELLLVSLVIPEQYKTEKEEIVRRYTILSLTRGFILQQLDKEPILKRELDERIRSVDATIEESLRAKKHYKFGLSFLGAITEEDKVAAMIIQTAFQKYQTGMYADAVDDYRRAAEIAPRFSSVYRNWAAMEAEQGHLIQADELMRKAAGLNEKDPLIWLTWGVLKKRSDKIREAHEYLQKAYDLASEDHSIINALAQTKSRLGLYKDADNLLKKALSFKSTLTIKREVIHRSSLAQNLSKWSESLAAAREYADAEAKLKEAILECERCLNLDESDTKSQEIYRGVLIDLGYLYKLLEQYNNAAAHFMKAIVKQPNKYSEIRDSITAGIEVAKIFFSKGELEKAEEICVFLKKYRVHNPELERKLKAFCNQLEEIIPGKIISIGRNGDFLIIESSSAAGVTYFGHISDMILQVERFTEELIGKQVRFIPVDEIKGGKVKRKAKFIKIL